MKATRQLTTYDLRKDRIAGSYRVLTLLDRPTGIQFICPCGCGNESYMNLNENNGHPRWTLTGSLDEPTLAPSVHQTGMSCKWHGWLRKGRWEKV